jgi:NAD-dependent dihydropyrimidine dehydrogenase PreA subunit
MLAEAAANGCDLVVAAHLPPRATRWTLDALGCPAGRVRVLDLRSCADADACVAALREAIGAAEVVPLALGAATAAPALRWYPVIDRDRCTGCGQCQDFCLFGVYATGADGAVRVAHGDACTPGCPACARVCPAGAIMFPHYRDPAIAGAEAADAPAPAAADQARAERDACAAGDDGLDALIDALDRLDDDPLP